MQVLLRHTQRTERRIFATEVPAHYNSEVIHTTMGARTSCGGVISPAEGRGPIT